MSDPQTLPVDCELEIKDADRVRVLNLNRPDKRNALSTELLTRLHSELTTRLPAETRAVIIAARGPVFCAGADILEYSRSSDFEFQRFTLLANEICSQIQQLNTPVIAAVHGPALGGGFELALACDFIIASEEASFSLPELNLGLIPGWGGTRRLTHLIGAYRTRHLLLTGQRLSAQEAHALGFVSRVYPKAELGDAAREIAVHISQLAPEAVAASLNAIRSVDASGVSTPSDNSVEQAELFRLFNSPDGREGLHAFLNKRAPRFIQ